MASTLFHSLTDTTVARDVANTVRVITEYVPPEDVPAALDKLRDLRE
jgi:hypothetical protein